MPLNRSRAGFTLVELLIVMVLMGMVGAIVVRVLTDTQRLTVAQSEQAMVQSTTRTGVLVLPSELREINPALGDIKVMDDTSITYRGMRTLGISCVQPTKASVRVLTSSIAGLKVDFLANDSLLLFVEGDPTTATDDGWALARVAAVSSATACPTGPGTTLTLQPNVRMADNPAVEPDDSWFPAVAIVRGFENTVIASYEDANGDTWLGMESPAGAAIQPVLGPLAADSGLRFTYRDAAGAVTATPTAVRSIDVRVLAVTSRPVHHGPGAAALAYDSLTTQIALRNTF